MVEVVERDLCLDDRALGSSLRSVVQSPRFGCFGPRRSRCHGLDGCRPLLATEDHRSTEQNDPGQHPADEGSEERRPQGGCEECGHRSFCTRRRPTDRQRPSVHGAVTRARPLTPVAGPTVAEVYRGGERRGSHVPDMPSVQGFVSVFGGTVGVSLVPALRDVRFVAMAIVTVRFMRRHLMVVTVLSGTVDVSLVPALRDVCSVAVTVVAGRSMRRHLMVVTVFSGTVGASLVCMLRAMRLVAMAIVTVRSMRRHLMVVTVFSGTVGVSLVPVLRAVRFVAVAVFGGTVGVGLVLVLRAVRFVAVAFVAIRSVRRHLMAVTVFSGTVGVSLVRVLRAVRFRLMHVIRNVFAIASGPIDIMPVHALDQVGMDKACSAGLRG